MKKNPNQILSAEENKQTVTMHIATLITQEY